MSWVSAAILSAAVLGLVSIIDSRLISRLMPSLQAFLLPVGIIYLILGLVLFIIFPLPEGIGTWPLLVAIASGILRAVPITLMLYTMKSEEVSRIIPVVHTYPVFVAIMAAPLLGETLYYLQWLAIIIVVAGAVMVSVRQSPTGSTTWLGRSFLILFGSSLLMAVANVASKYALAYFSPWNMYYIGMFCVSSIFLLLSIRPHVLKELGNMKQRNSALGLLAVNETLALIGIVLSLWAMARGPISLVSPIIGSRPIFVVIFALLLSRISPMFLEWQPGKGTLALRLMATAMIVGGIAIIYLA